MPGCPYLGSALCSNKGVAIGAGDPGGGPLVNWVEGHNAADFVCLCMLWILQAASLTILVLMRYMYVCCASQSGI